MIVSVLGYLRRGGRTLMLHKRRGPQRGRHNGLGGKLEPGESPEEALRREVLEESGLALRSARLRGLLTFPAFDGAEDWLVIVYTSDDFEGEPRASDEGDLLWVPDGELSSLDLHAGDRVFLPWLDGERPFSATLRYREGRFVGHEATFY